MEQNNIMIYDVYTVMNELLQSQWNSIMSLGETYNAIHFPN